jgi:hypothetical protein
MERTLADAGAAALSPKSPRARRTSPAPRRGKTMNTQAGHDKTHAGFRLHFRPLYGRGPGFAFPCDAEGRVDIDRLGETERRNYFFARSLVGREFHTPEIEAVRP